ncbi:TPA: hypothetical protein IAA91_01365 [Candidatus Avacholeplasma faecigallinarum]|nr:hypothetical protein [Candidatus Avacholeplasma faecigallinarum]
MKKFLFILPSVILGLLVVFLLVRLLGSQDIYQYNLVDYAQRTNKILDDNGNPYFVGSGVVNEVVNIDNETYALINTPSYYEQNNNPIKLTISKENDDYSLFKAVNTSKQNILTRVEDKFFYKINYYQTTIDIDSVCLANDAILVKASNVDVNDVITFSIFLGCDRNIEENSKTFYNCKHNNLYYNAIVYDNFALDNYRLLSL